MINSVQATPEHGWGRTQRGRLVATLLSRSLAFGLFLLWPLVHANGQSFTFNPISPKAVAVGNNLTLTLSVTPLPPDGVLFGHGGAAPANSFPTNAFLDSISGVFNWTPNQYQLGVNSITVWAFEPSNLYNSNYTTFSVIVTNALPPVGGVVIDTIPPQTVAEGATLIFTNHARATRQPQQRPPIQPH